MSSNASQSDINFLITRTTIVFVLYAILQNLFPQSKIPLTVFVIAMLSSFHKIGTFSKLLNYFKPSTSTSNQILRRQSISVKNAETKSRSELVGAIKALQSYSANTKEINDRRKRLFKLMSWRQQKLCNDLGYTSKLKQIDKCVIQNQSLLSDISLNAISKYNLKYSDLNSFNSVQLESTNNYRVIESLGHFVRDWCKEGDVELKPLLKYISSHLNAVIPPNERSKTCIIVPGSGLGRIAHEIAMLGVDTNNQFGSVQSVEFSWLMNLCNDFVYKSDLQEKSQTDDKDYELYPYVHTCSNHTSTANQLRSTTFNKRDKPSNLSLNYGDFRYFKVPNIQDYDNIVIVSAFFLDTAENLMDYLDHIEKLTSPTPVAQQELQKGQDERCVKNGYWINAGPLKYGTAAQVQFNLDEMRAMREKLGWIDLDECSFNHKYINEMHNVTDENPGMKELVGYLTDRESLWQGFYGLGMWCSERRENFRSNKK